MIKLSVNNKYSIDENGNVYNSDGKIKKPFLSRGYLRIELHDKGRKKYFVHTLLAIAYLGYDINSDLVINHKDRNRLNNSLENIEITSYRYNNLHTHFEKKKYLPGVNFRLNRKKGYYSMIQIGGETHWLGSYYTEMEAYKAYKSKLKEINDNETLSKIL